MLTLYTITTCDTCRKARRALDAQGTEYRLHDLRRDGVPQALIDTLLAERGAAGAANKRSKTWRELDDADKRAFAADAPDTARARALLAEHPTLLKRPLLTAADGILLATGYRDGDYADLGTL
ncbi:ArsC family reductase [Halomonas cibimaris]|uniref:ArsC family reductase n=1 Tax=Halomonas cibimaris TaxID=657012 RepID=A0ABP7M007_9GAMM